LEPSSTPLSSDGNGPARNLDDFEGGATQPILGVIVATAVLYIAKDIFIPLTVASLLAVIFTPIASRLERFVGCLASSLLVVVTAIIVIAGIGYFFTVELTSVAVQITAYTDNIAEKITALKGSTPEWLQRVEGGVKDVEQQITTPAARTKRSLPAVVAQAPATQSVVEQVVRPALPILSGLIEGLFIIILFFFFLYGRKDVRDRLVRLTARVRITLSAEGIESAADAIGDYLLLFAVTNAGYGLAVGVAMWLFGLPNPALWGALAGLLRFIPYVGVPVAALLATSVAFAVFPGWTRSFEVLGSFIVVDQIVGYAVEPFVIGAGIGLSPLALLVSAMFWSWLWGLPGLLLATSLTACLKVAGDYIPALGFLAVLLGADNALDDSNDYYRSLLELDVLAARKIASRYCDQNGLEATFDNVLIPAVILAGEERAEAHISPDNQQLINDTTVEVVNELGDKFNKKQKRAGLRIVGICAPGEAHRLGLQMLLMLLHRSGATTNLVDENKSPAEIRDLVKRYAPDLVFLSLTTKDCAPAALGLISSFKLDSPNLTIICGGIGSVGESSELLRAGASQICETRSDVRRAVRVYALGRSL
jgi:predicted PurR-regulated permease PerM